jgi:hypothetical protein
VSGWCSLSLVRKGTCDTRNDEPRTRRRERLARTPNAVSLIFSRASNQLGNKIETSLIVVFEQIENDRIDLSNELRVLKSSRRQIVAYDRNKRKKGEKEKIGPACVARPLPKFQANRVM